ncbi:MAG TPA: RDD family protein [Albitalea sp.]|jgi:uncharacterized RDD family membrane protein YckC|nr:RDD family protein [Albitalea sp.]
MSGAAAASSIEPSVPSLRRRLACFVYEGVLLFGVLMISGYLFSSLTQQRHALVGRHALQAFLFMMLAIYFAWFWSHGGQTVAMKAWHIRVVDRGGQPLSQGRALARYLLSWLWFAPALLVLYASGLHSLGAIFGVLLAGVLGYAITSRLHPSHQFLHDVLCGTRLVDSRPAG